MANHDEELFWNLVDQFIQNANDACDQADPGVVSAALLNAAARFNAFVVASSSLDRKEYIEEMDSSLNYLTGRYREILRDNLEDYRDHYKEYVRPDEKE
ncbi:MAG: DUF3144 domain-containing protein [Cellvibrio sp.]|jgi:Protein of unknown function (DUF3144).